MGNINIGRQAWAGIALEATPNVGVSPTDYLQFISNTLLGQVTNTDISNATQNRYKNFSSVPTKKWGQGDLEFYADPKMSGYFLVGAFGAVSTATVQSNVFDHTITIKNSNSTPQTLTIISDRQGSAIDREAYYSAVVDQLAFTITDGIGTFKASLISNFPQTTTSGTATTASGTVYAFPSAQFAFGSTVAAADTAAQNNNLKVHEFSYTIKNNAKPVFRHGSLLPDTINVGDFEAETNFKLYFENNTDLQSYYKSSKQAAELLLTGNGLAGGFKESTKIRWYQTRIDALPLETGLSNFYIEDVKMVPEFDNANNIGMDCVIRNNKTLYI